MFLRYFALSFAEKAKFTTACFDVNLVQVNLTLRPVMWLGKLRCITLNFAYITVNIHEK